MAGDREKVADRLRGLCSRREYCSSEVMKKAMTALEGDSHAAEEVVGILISEKYVDDLRYASAFARDKASIAGWGDVKIRYMLSSKGIPKGIIDEALGGIDHDKASGKLDRILVVKAKSLKGDPQAGMKLLRFAIGRGYGYEQADNAIKRILNDGGYE